VCSVRRSFRFRSKRRKYERKSFRLEQKKTFKQNRRTPGWAAHFRFCSKQGRYERKPFRLNSIKKILSERHTLGWAFHFRFRSKQRQCEQKTLRLEPKKTRAKPVRPSCGLLGIMRLVGGGGTRGGGRDDSHIFNPITRIATFNPHSMINPSPFLHPAEGKKCIVHISINVSVVYTCTRCKRNIL
jgi:hypothetical protein